MCSASCKCYSQAINDEQLINCGINPGLVRFSVGLEDVNDIIEDIEQSLNKI